MTIYLEQTSICYPEQYDAYLNEEPIKRREDGLVGYLRLRNGHFTVEVPDVGGELVYEYEFDEGDKGFFEDDEREYYLNKAKEAILQWVKAKK